VQGLWTTGSSGTQWIHLTSNPTDSQRTPFINSLPVHRTHSFPGRRLLGLTIAAIPVSGALIGWALVSLRAEAVRSGEELTYALAQVVGEQTIRALEPIEASLLEAAIGIGELEAIGGLDKASVRELLRAQLKKVRAVRAIRVVDAKGRIQYGSDEFGLGVDVTDRAYFQVYKQDPKTTFYIGPPARIGEGGSWFITAAWPLRSPTGSFAGLIVAVVEPKYFEAVWGAVEVESGGFIALFRRDAVLIARSPMDEGAVGLAFPGLPLFATWLPQNPSGTFHGPGASDTTPRIVSYRTLPTTPEMVVAVGRPEDIVLANWREFRTLAVSIWALASAFIIALAFFLRRAWHERKKAEVRVEQMAQRLGLATDAASIGVWDWNLATDQWYATDTYFTMLGTKPEDRHTLRKEWLERVHPDERAKAAAQMQVALESTDAPYHHVVRLRHADGSFRSMSIVGRILARDMHGKPTRLLGVMIDITESKDAERALRTSLQDKEALLKEVHHRVKNNLQVIVSLLNLESSRAAPEARTPLKEMQGRIRAMALLHETLYRSKDLASVDLAAYVEKVASQLFRAQNSNPSVALQFHLAPVRVGIDQAIPCGLIVNELVTNSLKHAFPDKGQGEVHVRLSRQPDESVRLEVTDTGASLPADFDQRMGKALGLQLVRDLARQLAGELTIEHKGHARFAITFKTDQTDAAAALT
jgi:PAS domain S-box-containing protein